MESFGRYGRSLRDKILVAAAAGFVVTGCTAVPTVEYLKVTRDNAGQLDGREIDSYYLAGTVITLSRKQIDGKMMDDVVVQAQPAEFTDFKLALRRAGSFGVKTNVNFVKIENTGLVQEAGVDVVDNRIEYINKAGGALVKLAALTGFSTTEFSLENLPMQIRLVERPAELGTDGKAVEITENGVTIAIKTVPVDAKALEKVAFPLRSNAFLYSACREAIIKFAVPKGKDSNGNAIAETHVHTVKVADPRFIQQVGFPIKGKVKTHSQCGVTVQTDKDGNIASPGAVTEAVLTQLQALKDQHEKNAQSNKK
jgi:hypothetical protein